MRISYGIMRMITKERTKRMLNETEAEVAQMIQARLRGALETLAANGATGRELNQAGRDRLRARAILSAQAQMRELRERSDNRERGAFQRAYRAAFGLSLDRSAEDRALRAELGAAAASGDLGPVEAQARMDSALAIGDTMVARALSEIAFEHRNDDLGGQAWITVCETYGGYTPAVDRVLSAVFEAGAIPHKIDVFRDRTATEIQVPPDLRGSLEAIAVNDATGEDGSQGSGYGTEPDSGTAGASFGGAF